MSAPQPSAFPYRSRHTSGQTLRFRFGVTWASLSAPPAASNGRAREPMREPVESVPVPVAPPPAVVVPSRSEAPEIPTPSRSTDRWEMVVPKMGRPPAASSPSPLVQAPAAPRMRNPPVEIASIAAPREERHTLVEEPEHVPAAAWPDNEPFPNQGPFASLHDEESLWHSLWYETSFSLKVGIVGVMLVAMAGTYYLTEGTGAPAAPQIVVGPALPVGLAGWDAEYASYPPGPQWMHRVSLIKASLNLTDFRMEFQAQIENKAVGWAYRVRDPKNYYVAKLQIVKPGPSPVVALTRWAVIDGQEEPHTQIPLSIPTFLDTFYKVRLEAVGPHFTVWVQDQEIERWNDFRIIAGGVGFYTERGERANLKGEMTVFPLIKK